MTAAAPGGLSPLSQVARVERACEDSSRIRFGLHDLLFGWSQEIVGWVASPHLSASKKTTNTYSRDNRDMSNGSGYSTRILDRLQSGSPCGRQSR
jgi:hypothetical protein